VRIIGVTLQELRQRRLWIPAFAGMTIGTN